MKWCGFLLAVVVSLCGAADIKGAIELDSFTFNKIVGTPHFDVLVKFDKAYPYGDEEDQYKEFVKLIGEADLPNLLVTTVGVEDHGENKNDDLKQRFGIAADQFPQFRLFPKGSAVPIVFEGKVSKERLSQFINQRLGVWVGLKGCLEKFDALATGYLSLSAEEKKGVLASAEALLKGLEADSKEMQSAQVYVKAMKDIIANGKASEVEDKNQETLNIVGSFTKYMCKSGHSGCLLEMDRIADTLTADKATHTSALASAQKQAALYVDEADLEAAKVYLAIFKKITEKQQAYADAEKARLNKLLSSSISETKKKQFNFKLTILGAFAASA